MIKIIEQGQAAQRLVLTNKFITSLKAVLFEFHDRRKCLALPDVIALNGINVNRLRDLRVNYETIQPVLCNVCQR